MKKIYSFLFAAVTVFAAASCQKEVDNNVQATPAEDTFTVTATVGLDTKTTLDENGKSTLWTAGDKISVFDMNPAGNNCCFEIATEDLPAATAEFKYTGTFIRPDVNENPDPFLVALYPYQSTALCDFASSYKITGISVPTEQVAKADGFDSAATFALAIGTESTKNDLKFNNLYSLLKFTVADEGVKSVTVAVNSEAKLAGEATVQLAVGQTGITGGALAATGSSSVTLECEEGFTVGETYYIAVAPVSYTSLTVSLDETVVKTVSTAKTLNANTIYNLGNLQVPEQAAIRINNKNGWSDLNITIKSGVTTLVENKPMTDEGNNVFVYKLDPQYVGQSVTYYINHSWYQTSTKTVTLTTDSQSDVIDLHTTYLQPNDWNSDSPRYGAHIWVTGEAGIWINANKVKDGFYEVEIPVDANYTNIIWCRMNPGNPTNDWSSVWNQTGNLELKHKCYCIQGSDAWSQPTADYWY